MSRFEILVLDGAGKTHVFGVTAATHVAARTIARLSAPIKPAVVLTVISETRL